MIGVEALIPSFRFFIMDTNSFALNAANDKSLSWKARGILFHILSQPSGWILRQSDLVASSDKDGREATGNAIKELIKAGYLIKTEMREAGKFIGIKYTLNLVP